MQKRNVIVVMFDSLSFMYMGCYGNKWIKTPNMDRLAREGVLFENNYIENLPTIPCRRSMHTGRFRLHDRGWSPLELEETTIADLCWGRPIDTALVFDCPMYRLPKFGYTRGFDKVEFTHGQEMDHEYFHTDPLIHLDPRDYLEDHVLEALGKALAKQRIGEVTEFLRQTQYFKTDEDHHVAKTMKKAVKYLENIDRNKSFFLWVDCFDPHEPWDAPSVYDPDLKNPYDPDYKGKDMFLPPTVPVKGVFTEPEMNHCRMLYAEMVTLCDKWLGHLLDKVRALGLEDDTLFLLVSDHGEPMGNGKDGHGYMLKCQPYPYEELAHAPMLMRGPGLPAGKRVKAFTQSPDVAPTVTDWLGIGVHPSHTGKSLLPLAKGDVDKVRDFAIAGMFNMVWSIYTEEYSYFYRSGAPDLAHNPIMMAFAAAYAPLGRLPTGPIEAAASSLAQREGENLAALEKRLHEDSIATDEGMWTSVAPKIAGSSKDIELYDRQADPFQLEDIASKEPRKAAEMHKALMDVMNDLRKS